MLAFNIRTYTGN